MAKISETTFECKALVDAPEFNIKKGDIFIDTKDQAYKKLNAIINETE